MPIDLEREGHIGMSQPFTHQFRIDPGRQPLGGAAVPEIMNADRIRQRRPRQGLFEGPLDVALPQEFPCWVVKT